MSNKICLSCQSDSRKINCKKYLNCVKFIIYQLNKGKIASFPSCRVYNDSVTIKNCLVFTMTALSSALDNLLHRKNDFCCLCLRIIYEKPIHIHDDVAVNISQEELNLPVSEVLTSVLGDEVKFTFNN